MFRLRSFGPPVLTVERTSIPLAAERRFQLLAFLACSADWVGRDQLLGLFWADQDGAAARRNLRGLLYDLRKLPWLTGFESRTDSVRWVVASDRRDFESALARQSWPEAAALFRGPFLDGMEANATAAFGEWLRFERESLLDRWRDAVDRHLDSLRGDATALAGAAHHALSLDPLNESVLLALLAAHDAEGRHDAALRAYDTYRARLAREIGIEPSARLHARVEDLRQPTRGPPRPAPSSSGAEFIGRRIELRDLTAHMRRDDCRRVNVLGPGGIGKSSLARAVMPLVAAAFPDGVFWIDLRELADASQVGARCAEAIGLKLRGERDAWEQIASQLRDACALLVLDNCEHLPELGSLGDRLVADCPRLKVLHTSRVRLGGRSEWVFPLAGLPVPDEDETELAAVRAFDAVRLFEARAFAVAPAFELGAHALEVAQLVRAFDGLPLAIELAASCVRVLPVRVILDDLAEDPERLDATAAGDARASERGLRASFLRSWQLLTPVERLALAQLSVFAGAFDRVSAEFVARASLPVLAALVDKSLLRVDGDRFSLHPLIRGFALARLADEASVRARHADYFARWLAAHAHRDGRERPGRIEQCLPDCVAAWRWSCDRGTFDLVAKLAPPLVTVLDESGRWGEGTELFRGAQVALADAGPRADLARAAVARSMSLMHHRRGESDAAERRARESLRLSVACRSPQGVDVCLNLIGGALRQRGEWAEARRFFDRALRRALAGGNGTLALRIANNVATVEMATGHPEHAIGRCEALLAEHGDTADPLGIAMTLIILGNANSAMRQHELAQRWYEKGLALADQHGLVTVKPFFLQTLGTCHRVQGRADLARDFYRRTLASPRDGLEPQLEINAWLGLARIEMATASEAAAQSLQQALAVALRTGSPGWRIAVVAGFGAWHAARGELERAATLLAFAAGHPAFDTNLARETAHTFDGLGLSESQRAAARTHAAQMTLEQVIAELHSR